MSCWGSTMKLLSVAVAGAAMAFTAVPAEAALLQFTLVGSYNASWLLDSNPVPRGSGGVFDVTAFRIYDVAGSFPSALTGVADLKFFASQFGGGLQINDFYKGDMSLVSTGGEQLFTGSTAMPAFRTGTFALTEYDGNGTYALKIAAVAAAVPEPMSWALMIGGFGIVGGAMRRWKNVSTTFKFA